jgi:hypothetical protein
MFFRRWKLKMKIWRECSRKGVVSAPHKLHNSANLDTKISFFFSDGCVGCRETQGCLFL